MKMKSIILIGISAIICFLLIYFLGDSWLVHMAPGKENVREATVNVIGTIN
ncbi:hypothetical protein [Bacillus cereus]|uniref:hypothetical protein n=1 Tax=Bacillus cereus TaxID=1396 RepID=UPI001594E914|nr:hypothetical protein [Bacillus cereus]